MYKPFLTIAGLAMVLAVAVSCQQEPTRAADNLAGVVSETGKKELVARGEYLVNVIGCDDCHSTKIMGPQGPMVDTINRFGGRLSSQAPMVVDSSSMKTGWVLMAPDLTVAVGPWGTSYAANISSDDTGIGTWSEEQFFKCMREGKYKGLDNSRPLLPPMPWFNFAKLSDDDLRAIFYYLKSTKPIHNVVPAALPPAAM